MAVTIGQRGRPGSAERGSRTASGERGNVTAEFAVVLPAVILILGCCLGGIRLVTLQLQLADAASIAARIVARGESMQAAVVAADSVVAGATLTERTGEAGVSGAAIVCITAQSGRSTDFSGIVTVSASSCSLRLK